jgi:hypothetical protein
MPPRRKFDSEKHERNVHGRLVSKKKRAVGKTNRWASAVKAARDQLGIKGFVPIKKGTKLYDEAKKLYLSS